MDGMQGRLLTFRLWKGKMSAESLADAGFIHSCGGVEVMCPVCCKKMIIGMKENPIQKHLMMSPTCPLIKRLLTEKKMWIPTLESLASQDLLPMAVIRDLHPMLLYSLACANITDHQTPTHIQPPFIVHPSYMALMKQPSQRISTFKEGWPTTCMNPSTFANTGFFFLQVDDVVQCAFCHRVFTNWTKGQHPFLVHYYYAPYCANRARSPDATDCNYKLVDAQWLDQLEIHIHRGPIHSHFAKQAVRRASFDERQWDTSMGISCDSLAEAGFYCSMVQHEVICFYCGGEWQVRGKDDIPWIQHARHYPSCGFLILTKGQSFIRLSKYHPHHALSLLAKTPAMTAAPQDSPATPPDPEKRMGGCKLCVTGDSEVVFLPCRHLAACASCAVSLTVCSVCHQPIRGSIRVYP